MNKTRLNHLLFIVQVLILLFLCFIHALSAGHTCDFWPINGTFQNYNPVRRFLSGQIPYKDFTDYLGLGHLYAGAFFTYIFGGNYQASLVAFSFLTIISFSSISFWIGKSITRSSFVAVSVTNIFLLVLLIQPPFFKTEILTGAQIHNALNSTLGSGNSARFVRGFIIPILIMLFYFGSKYIKKSNFFSQKYKRYVCDFLIAQLASLSVFWSNDYGFSCCICTFCIFTWYLICYFHNLKTVFLHFVVYLVSCLLGIFIIGEIVTIGHFFSWCKTTFGIGDFQRWYYLGGGASYLYEIDFSYLTILQFGICCVYAWKILVSNAEFKSLLRYGIPAFCNLVGFCAINEYRLLSGGLMHEVAYSVLFVTLAFEIISLLNLFFKDFKFITKINFFVITTVLCFTWITPTIFNEILFSFSNKPQNSIVELGRGGGVFVQQFESRTRFPR